MIRLLLKSLVASLAVYAFIASMLSGIVLMAWMTGAPDTAPAYTLFKWWLNPSKWSDFPNV